MSQEPEITLSDVESAIKVLTLFLRKQKDAQRIIRHLGAREGRGLSATNPLGLSMEDMFRMAAEARLGTKQQQTETTVEVSEEDLKRMRAIAEKTKK